MTKTAVPSRNAYVELCRFIAACVIMLHHTGYMGGPRLADGGWIFVEYFFILSGYFMTRHFEQAPPSQDTPVEKTALLYTLNKLSKALPYAAFGALLGAVAQIGCGYVTVENLGVLITELPFYLFFLNVFGFVHYDIALPLWYLSAILCVMPCLTLLMLKARNFYKHIASWNVPLLLYTMMYALHGNVLYWGRLWFVNCLLRAVAALTLGSLAYYLSEYFKRRSISQKDCVYLSAVEAVLFFAVVALAVGTDCRDYAMPCILFSLISLIITFSGKDLLQNVVPQWCAWLGKLSLPMFCIHRSVFDAVKWLAGSMDFTQKLWIGFVATLLLSAASLWAVETVSRRRKSQVRTIV